MGDNVLIAIHNTYLLIPYVVLCLSCFFGGFLVGRVSSRDRE